MQNGAIERVYFTRESGLEDTLKEKQTT